MQVLQISTGGDRNYGYLILAEKEAALVDPGEDPGALLKALAESGATLKWVIATHTHNDHVASLPQLERTGWQSVISSDGALSGDLSAESNPELPLGQGRIKLLPTPGHTPCSLCVLVPDDGGKPAHLITGDTLFVGKIGGTATEEQSRQEYHSLHDVLLKLPDQVQVWPGHNYGSHPTSTIGEERKSNPFLIQPDFAAFCHLKANWAQYKIEHGIS